MDENNALPLPEQTQVISVDDLAIQLAKDFAHVITVSTSSALVDCKRVGPTDDTFFRTGDEIVIFDVLVEVGQRPVNDIRYQERIAVHFDAAGRIIPWVYALRDSFPVAPHENALHFDKPKCLCIYETAYEELKIEWRAVKFLADIRGWLALTAEGALHQEDQALEPFLITNAGTIIIPPGLKAGEAIYIYSIAHKFGRMSLLASRKELTEYAPHPNHVIFIQGNPQEHGVMGRTPANLSDLHALLKPAGIDLLPLLKTNLQALPKDQQTLGKRLSLFAELPRTNITQTNGANDHYVFLTGETIEEIGLKLGFFDKSPDGKIGNVLFQTLDESMGRSLIVGVLLPQIQIDPELALILSGNIADFEQRATAIFQIGAGALGSQFFLNQARAGFGRWVITDDDFLMPHNLVRHGLDMNWLGNFKSAGLAITANQLFGTEDFALGLDENYLHPGNPDAFNIHLTAAQVIVDISTSVAVARHLAARTDTDARRLSIFLSPSGSDLVILAEDEKRTMPLDVLEFQYYQKLISEPGLEGHLQAEPGMRLSNSCRDVTSRIPQEYVAMLAAIAAKQFRQLLKSPDALIGIWRINKESIAVAPYISAPSSGHTWKTGDWVLYISQQLINKISAARLAQLPNETGGILIGGYDLERKKIYLVDTILSPDDSEQYPNAYIRGIEGVEGKLTAYNLQTADHLKYTGEWHSHPKGCGLGQSDDDLSLFAYLEVHMSAIGLPALMLIAGDDENYNIYLRT